MKRNWIALPAGLALALTLSSPAIAKTPEPPKSGQMKSEGKEEHPHIEAAIKALETAKQHLQTATHDFNGHRAKALDHVNAALEECRDALKVDKK
jgi:hypothetical protein